MLENTIGAIKNEQSRETASTVEEKTKQRQHNTQANINNVIKT